MYLQKCSIEENGRKTQGVRICWLFLLTRKRCIQLKVAYLKADILSICGLAIQFSAPGNERQTGDEIEGKDKPYYTFLRTVGCRIISFYPGLLF